MSFICVFQVCTILCGIIYAKVSKKMYRIPWDHWAIVTEYTKTSRHIEWNCTRFPVTPYIWIDIYNTNVILCALYMPSFFFIYLCIVLTLLFIFMKCESFSMCKAHLCILSWVLLFCTPSFIQDFHLPFPHNDNLSCATINQTYIYKSYCTWNTLNTQWNFHDLMTLYVWGFFNPYYYTL